MPKQTVTLILDFLRKHPGLHSTAEVAERCGVERGTASKNLGVLWKYEPGVERIRAGLYMYRGAETEPCGPESNGAGPARPAGALAPDREPRPGSHRYGAPGAAVQAERPDPFAPPYGPPFRIRIESSFQARSGRTCYRIRAEDGREGTLLWEDDPWP